MKKEENAVGENIRRLRMRNQLKQADLAQKLNISRQSLSAYERGITLPDIYLLIEIADFFRISLDELTGRITIHRNNLKLFKKSFKLKSLVIKTKKTTQKNRKPF